MARALGEFSRWAGLHPSVSLCDWLQQTHVPLSRHLGLVLSSHTLLFVVRLDRCEVQLGTDDSSYSYVEV